MEGGLRVLGVDGGGTKTLAALADREGCIHALVAGPDTNPLTQPDWPANVTDIVARALQDTPLEHLAGAAFGLPVFGEVDDISAEQAALVARLVPGSSLRNDVHSAHEAAFAGGPGVLLLSGTGSMCWAADASGRTLRVGGWGDAFGDEGSAYWIGHAALARTSQILDGRLAGEAFADTILDAIGTARANMPDGLLRWFYRHPNRRPAVAALAAIVDRLEAGGDSVAGGVLDDAADALAQHVRTARRLLGLAAGSEWCFVGGVSRSLGMRVRLAARLDSPPTAPRLPPVGGALWRAAHDAGWQPDVDWVARVNHEIAQRWEPS